MKNRFLLSILFLLLPLYSICADNAEDNTYPTPERLFHIARSANKNIICYDVHLKDGNLDLEEPLEVYWVNREERPGETNGLSFIQRKFAYGYDVVSTSEKAAFCTLSAYPKRQLTITHLKTGYACLVKINHQTAILQSLYVKAHPHNPLKVEYVELRGISLATHRPLCERINN